MSTQSIDSVYYRVSLEVMETILRQIEQEETARVLVEIAHGDESPLVVKSNAAEQSAKPADEASSPRLTRSKLKRKLAGEETPAAVNNPPQAKTVSKRKAPPSKRRKVVCKLDFGDEVTLSPKENMNTSVDLENYPQLRTENEVITFLAESKRARKPLAEIQNYSQEARTNLTLNLECDDDNVTPNEDLTLKSFMINQKRNEPNAQLLQTCPPSGYFNEQILSITEPQRPYVVSMDQLIDPNNNNFATANLNTNAHSQTYELNTPVDIHHHMPYLVANEVVIDNYHVDPDQFEVEVDEMGITVVRENTSHIMSYQPPPKTDHDDTLETTANIDVNNNNPDVSDHQLDDSQSDHHSSQQSHKSLMWNGVNLLDLNGKTLNTYAYSVADFLFPDREEIYHGIFVDGTVTKSKTRHALDPERTNLIRESIMLKFDIPPIEMNIVWQNVKTNLNNRLRRITNDHLKRQQKHHKYFQHFEYNHSDQE